jgi:hypothetical protein
MIAGLSVLGGTAPALAQPAVSAVDREAARQNYKEASLRFERGDYAGAVGLFEQAEAIAPIWQTKFKIAQCRDKLGQAAEAVRWYKAFLDSNPPAKLASSVAEAQSRLAVLRSSVSAPPAVAKTGQIRFAIMPPNAPGLTISVDGAPAQPAAVALNVPPGHHRVVIQAPGYNPAAAEVDIPSGEVRELRVALTPAAAGRVAVVGPVAQTAAPARLAPVPGDQSSGRTNVPAYVLMGIGGAGMIVGAVFGGLALKDKSNYDAKPTQSGADAEHRDSKIADAALFGGLGVAAVGVVLLVTNTGASQYGSRGFALPYAGPGGGGLTGGLRF